MAVVQQNIQLHLISAFAVVVSIAYVWSIRKKANNITNGENLPEWIKIKSKELPSFQYPVNKQASPSLDKTQTQSMDTCLSLDKSKIHQLRQDHFCGSQSVSYSNTDPLLIVRGEGSKLYDEVKAIKYGCSYYSSIYLVVQLMNQLTNFISLFFVFFFSSRKGSSTWTPVTTLAMWDTVIRK